MPDPIVTTTGNLPSTTNVPNYAAPANLGVTASSGGGGSFTQGGALPAITTTQQAAQSAPQFYMNYLSNLASQGQQAAQNAQYVGPTAMQNQAFQQTQANVGNYNPSLQAAINAVGNVANANLAADAGAFMNPYTEQVVNAIGNLGSRNIANAVAPGVTAGLVGSGQFGSKRGAEAYGKTMADAALGLTAQQAQALQQGYGQSLQAALQQQQNRIAAGQQLGNLASTTQSLGLGDVNALATMGEQQRTLAQNRELFPMQQLTNQSALLRGYSLPTSTSSTYTGPIPGAYAASPLQQIAGLGALAAGISTTPFGNVIGSAISKLPGAISGLFSGSGGGTYTPNYVGPDYGTNPDVPSNWYDYYSYD